MERTDRLPLDPDEARCEPSKPCLVRHRCARAVAALPRTGAKLEDFSIREKGGTALCDGYLAVETVRKQAVPAPPRVHKPIGSEG